MPTTSLGELSGLPEPCCPRPEAATIRVHTDDGALLAAFLADMGMPNTAGSLHREHVGTIIVAESERTVPASAAMRYRSASATGSITRAGSADHLWRF
jgi:hypothetical protein